MEKNNQNKNKKSFILYLDSLDVIKELDDKQTAELFRAIIEYEKSGIENIKDKIVKVAFIPIKNSLDRNNEHWQDVKNKRREAGKLGGRPKKQTKAKKANAFSEKQTKAKKAVSVNVPVSVSVSNILPKGNTENLSAGSGNDPPKLKKGPRQDITNCYELLKSKLGATPDDSIQNNRRYIKLILDKLKKDYPSVPPDTIVCDAIELVYQLKDSWIRNNMTSFKWFYYNMQKIFNAIKSVKENSRVAVV